MSSPSPQVKSNPKSNQTNTNSTLTWDTILRSPRIEKQHVDFAINNLETAPQLPVEFVYSQVATDVKISPPTSVAISGVGGVIGAILVLRHTTTVKYFVTTQEVLDSDEKSPLYLSKYTLERLSKIIDAEVVVLKLNEFDKIKLLLKEGGVYISGLPYELVVQLSQLAGFGRLWHFSNISRKFYVF
ncbi:hypothetical protein [Sulfolobus monocaudavirus SMV4]|uniref:virion structural protein n=1 Tax=Sulfolobus monocaudavirus SMV4 TaxID=1732178 RepID=UPI000706DD69|nr:virion structural protein [Sulfolobus monocaudavirus SMV4]ALG97063.1 hypothetical protein [Sulfolobus monocaudavirus SMV4]